MFLNAMFFLGLGWLLILGIALVVMFVLGGIILAIGLISRYKNKKKGIKKKYPKICIIIGGIFLGISIGIFGVTAISFWSDSGNEYNPATYDPHKSTFAQDKQHCKEIIFEVIRCLDEDDTETLKSMFSDYAKELSELDSQISTAMNIYQGSSLSCNEYSYSGGGESSGKGSYYSKGAMVRMASVITDEGKEYYIEVVIQLADKEESEIGIEIIRIIDSNNRQNVLAEIGKIYG